MYSFFNFPEFFVVMNACSLPICMHFYRDPFPLTIPTFPSPTPGVFHGAPTPNPALENSKALELLVKTAGSQCN